MSGNLNDILHTPPMLMQNRIDPEPTAAGSIQFMRNGKWLMPACKNGCSVRCDSCRPLDWRKYLGIKDAEPEQPQRVSRTIGQFARVDK